MNGILQRILSFWLAIMLIVPFGSFAAQEDIVIDYPDIFNSIVDLVPTAVTDKTEDDGKKFLKVAPDIASSLYTDAGSKKKISLDSWGLDKYKIDFTKYKYISVEYKYISKEPCEEYPILHILPQKVLSKRVNITADDRLVSGRYANMTFFIPDISELILTPEKPYISQLHFLPFGETYVNELDAGDELLIGKITFSENDPKKDRHFTVNVDGKTKKVAPDSEFTLPAYTEKNGYVFKGYIPGSSRNQLLNPGDTVKITANITFTSYYVPIESMPTSADIVYGSFKDYYNCVVDGKDTGFAEINGEYLYARANPDTSNTNMQFKLDGWEYGGMRIAPTVHNYAYVLMRVQGMSDVRVQMNVMKSDVFSKQVSFVSSNVLSENEWCFAEFDVSTLKEEMLDPATNGFVKQIHFLPFGNILAKNVPADASVLIDKIIFSKDKLDLVLHDSIIGGYPDGTFAPEASITRAECAALTLRIARIPEYGGTEKIFEDVDTEDWFLGTVNALANAGIIDKTKDFRPNEPCTRAEFADMVYRTGLKKASVLGSFTDVSPDNKYYTSIREAAGAGIINGYTDGSFRPDNGITRAEAVKIISNASGRVGHIGEFDNVGVFSDIAADHWCRDIINELAIRHIMNGDAAVCTDAVSTGTGTNGGVSPELVAEGNAKKQEIDLLFEQKKNAILESPTAVEVTGTKYYVSNNGDDTNDGLSPESPWKTAEKVNNTKFNPGDGVFFERGGLWRTELVCGKGVTYSAYGEGAKPRFYGSPENGAVPGNWTLLEGTSNIWQYHLKMHDVGGIVIGGGEIIGEKIAPRMLDGIFYNTENSERFDVRTGLVEDLNFFVDIPRNDLKAPEAKGYVYMRCDKGNPGEVFDDIEFITRGYAIYFPNPDAVIDNLCAMYAQGGINGSFTVINATVQNCEVGYIGGNLQGYDVFSGSNGTPTRYGNGINFYGECDGYYVYNNYIHDVYDAGISNQYSSGGTNAVRNDNIVYSGNIIERCHYGIEYFMGAADAYVDRIMTNMHIDGNIIRDTGYGFGRKNPTGAAAIKGWDHNNHAENFTITNNIFCDSFSNLYHIGASYSEWLPKLSGNVYLQHAGRVFGKYGKNPTELFVFDFTAPERLKAALNEDNAEFYFFE